MRADPVAQGALSEQDLALSKMSRTWLDGAI